MHAILVNKIPVTSVSTFLNTIQEFSFYSFISFVDLVKHEIR